MKINTSRFGEIHINENEIITMPEGFLGFPDCNRFVFIDEDKAAPFRMFQSLDNPALAFVLVAPRLVDPDYKINIKPSVLDDLETDIVEELSIYCVVTMAQEIQDVTVNLQGPVLIGQISNLACQIVLVDQDEYTTKHNLI